MEKRLVLATVLSFLILIGYQMLFVKPKLPTTPVRPDQAVTVVKTPQVDLGAAVKAVPPAGSEVEGPGAKEDLAVTRLSGPVSEETEHEITVETELFRAVFSNRGGTLRSFKLKKHRNADKGELELVNTRAAELGRYPLSMWFEEKDAATTLNSALYKVDSGSIVLKKGETAEIKFEYYDGKLLSAAKTFRFSGDTYEIGIDIKANGINGPLKPYVIWGPGIDNLSAADLKDRYTSVSGAAVLSGGKVVRMDEKKYKPEKSAFNFVDWAAYEDNYFVALFVPAAGKGQAVYVQEIPAAAAAAATTVNATPKPVYYLAVSEPQRAFIGPKEIDALKAFGGQAKKVINFGFFGFIAEIVLVMVKYFYKLIPNWGLAIILMTVVIKIIFFPLTYSSSKSMAKMAEVQPKLKALKSKYKNAKTDIDQRRRMNEEMMALYKEHGINPAGGCLPLLIQLPVFWGVFRMLVVAVEMRQSPFCLWITDLSVRDPYYVTPILMGVTQFIQQKMTPSGADAAQNRMMLLMPFIMTIFFLNFQSGLVLYWLTQNVIQIGQQALMNKLLAAKKKETHGKRPGK